MKYINNIKHAIFGALFVSILMGFYEYENPVSAISYGLGMATAASVFLTIIYGFIWILMPKRKKNKFRKDKPK